jgi:hypothetical protein
VTGRARYAGPAHRTRAYRLRQTSFRPQTAPTEAAAADGASSPPTDQSQHGDPIRIIGAAEFERAIDQIDWIAEMWIKSPGYIGLYVGTLTGATWHVRVSDTKANRERLLDIASRAHVPCSYGTDPRTGDR